MAASFFPLLGGGGGGPPPLLWFVFGVVVGGGGGGEGRGLDDDGQLIELAELAVVLPVLLDVGLPGRQQLERGRREPEARERVTDRGRRDEDGERHGEGGARAGQADQPAQGTSDASGERHLLFAGDEPLEAL